MLKETVVTRVAISDRHFLVGVGKFSDRPGFVRQSRQNRGISKIGESANRGNGKIFCPIGSRSAKLIFFCRNCPVLTLTLDLFGSKIGGK